MKAKLFEQSGLGDCYEAAGKYMMDNCLGGCDLILIHGEVTGQGEISGIKYGHAWVEDGNTVIDKSNGRNVTMAKMMYYVLGKIGQPDMSSWGNPNAAGPVMTGGNVHKYTWEQARAKILDHGHWGPWDLETESGL
jgi:hypothetical protein